MHEEIKNTVYIAISAIILGLVLGMVGIMMFVRGQMADIRNDEIAAHEAANSFRQYNKYDMRVKDGKYLEGEGIIELLTTTYGNNIEIYVDNASRKISIDSTLTESIGWRKWLENVKEGGSGKFTSTELRDENVLDLLDRTFTFKRSDGTVIERNLYKTYLVYNSNDPKLIDIDNLEYSMNNLPPHSTVTGIAVIWTGYSIDDGQNWIDSSGNVITRKGSTGALDI